MHTGGLDRPSGHLWLRLCTAGAFVLGTAVFSEAYAYIDPSTGSLAIQAVLGALFGVGITLKIYWVRIKEKIQSRRR